MSRDSDFRARYEPFDTFWEAPKDIEKGYSKFSTFYVRNYLKYFPRDRNIKILIVSCGPGYMAELLNKKGYANVIGIDSDPQKINHAKKRNLNCRVERAFDYLRSNDQNYDVIFAEQEINHLTKDEIIEFVHLCWGRLNEKGLLFLHSLNGANPITGSEALAQNFDHYNTFTEYSLRQILEHSNFHDVYVMPLKLYVFYENPLNYVGLSIDALMNLLFKLSFKFYGKANSIFTKKIAAIGRKI